MVGLDDLDVVALVERPGGHLEQLHHDVDADAHVRRHDDRDPLRDGRRSRPSAPALKPVVPITALTPSSRQTARCASVPSGRVKSISTSALAEAGAQVGGNEHAALPAEEVGRVLADRRARRRRRARPPARRSRARGTASISMWPIRPEAPAMATRMAAGRGLSWARLERRVAALRRRRHRLRRRRLHRRRQGLELLLGERERRHRARASAGGDRGDELALARAAVRRCRCSPAPRP